MLAEVKESYPGKAVVDDIAKAPDSSEAAAKVLSGNDVRQS